MSYDEKVVDSLIHLDLSSMQSFLHILRLFLCFYLLTWLSCKNIFGQADSIKQLIEQTPDSLSAPLYVEWFLNQETDRSDTSGLQMAYRGVALAEQNQDTVSLWQLLRALTRRLNALGDSASADSVWLYRRDIMSSYGYLISEDFPSQWDNVRFNSRYQELRIWVDSTGNIPAKMILNTGLRPSFSLNQTAQTGLNPNYAYWVRLRLRGNDSFLRKVLLMPNLPNALWDSVDFYMADHYGGWIHERAGQMIPIPEKSTQSWLDFFEISVSPTADFYMYFRLKGFHGDMIPSWVSLAQLEDEFWAEEIKSDRNLMIFLGIFLFQLLFFGLFYIATFDREYLPYLLYLLGVVLFSVTALWFKHWFPRLEPFFTILAFIACSWISGLGLLRFSERFLNIKALLPKWGRVSRIFLIVFIAVPTSMILTVLYHSFIAKFEGNLMSSIINQSLQIYIFLFSAELVLLTIMSILVLRKGYSPALYYLIALTFLLGSIGLISLVPLFELYYLFEDQRAAVLIAQSGLMLQSCFFGLGIGHKRRLLEKEKLQAQETLNEELSKVNSAFGRFVPHTFIKAIGRESVLDIELGDGVEKEVTVFFSDIRDYTTLSEKMTPKQNFKFLNSYLGRLGPVIADHKGFVNQYYGDGIMAIFMNSPADALEASIRTQYLLRIYNEERVQKGRDPISIGLGLHTGSLMMGVIGDTLRMEAGVVSDTVNTAARMEGLTKYFGCNLVVSEAVIRHPEVSGHFHYRLLGKVQVKGKKDPLVVYDCFEGDEPELMTQKLNAQEPFECAMNAYYQRDFLTAAKAFDESLLIYPDDVAAQKYLLHCQDFIANGVPESWNGIEALQRK